MATRLLESVLRLESGLAAAAGWNSILDGICSREATIETGIDGPTVRRVVERIGSLAREKPSSVGPLTADDLKGAFTQVCGYPPDERAFVLLQRLPGLGVAEGDETARVFIDNDLAEVAKAGDVFRYLESPFEVKLPDVLGMCLGELGAQCVAYKASGFKEGIFVAAIRQARKRADLVLVADLVRAMQVATLGVSNTPILIEEVWIPDWTFQGDGPDISMVTVRSCVIEEIRLGSIMDDKSVPLFENCYIGRVVGRASDREMPIRRFNGCQVWEFIPTAQNTANILSADIPLGARVLLTILEKLYLQPGSGRLEGALYRGLDSREQSYVSACLSLVNRMRYGIKSGGGDKSVWHPVRARTNEVRSMLLNPQKERYEIMNRAWQLDSVRT